MSVKSHRRLVAATLASLCIPLSASAPALARPADPSGPYGSAQPVQPSVGDTPSDYASVKGVAPIANVGDTPSDHPGVSRAGQTLPVPPIQVVHPTRTIVRDSSPALPIVLSGLALSIALAAAASMLARRRGLQTRLH